MSVFPVSGYYNVPVLDADGMGRAYPTKYHGKCSRQMPGEKVLANHLQ